MGCWDFLGLKPMEESLNQSWEREYVFPPLEYY